MGPEHLLAAIALACLVVYSLTGGADFGGGVWDLFAVGPRGRAQREAIERAIGPIWEANHVWLIVLLVILFVGFPKAYATIGTALHIPLSLMLVGIVARGTAFVFRSYDLQHDRTHYTWSALFGVASVATPVMFGVSLGALASGEIRVAADGTVQTDFLSSWLTPFPWVVGLFTLSFFAFLAAVYLASEVDYRPLQEDFRRRALVSGVVTGVLAFATLFVSAFGAPVLWEGLLQSWWSWPFQVGTGIAAVAALFLVWRRRFRAAWVAATVQVGLIVMGWGAAQYPYLVVPDLTFDNTKAPSNVLWMMDIALLGGMVVLIPSFVFLYRVFRGRVRE